MKQKLQALIYDTVGMKGFIMTSLLKQTLFQDTLMDIETTIP